MNEKWEELKALLQQEETNLTEHGRQTIEVLLKEVDPPFSSLKEV